MAQPWAAPRSWRGAGAGERTGAPGIRGGRAKFACPGLVDDVEEAAAVLEGILGSLQAGVAELSATLRGLAFGAPAPGGAARPRTEEDEAEDEPEAEAPGAEADASGSPLRGCAPLGAVAAWAARRVPRGLRAQLDRQFYAAGLPHILYPSLANLISGYDSGVVTFVVMQLSDPGLIGGGLPALGAWELGAVASSRLCGALGGSLLVLFNRADPSARDVLLWSALGMAAVSAAALCPPSRRHLLLLRLLAGALEGISSPAKVAYTAETIEAELRGAATGARLTAFGVGTACGVLVGASLMHVPGAWHMMLAASALPSLVMAAGMLSLPHSPRWLVGGQGQLAAGSGGRLRAEAALQVLRPRRVGETLEARALRVRAALAELDAAAGVAGASRGAWPDAGGAASMGFSLEEFLRSPGVRISTWALFFKQASGGVAVATFVAPVAVAMGLQDHLAALGVAVLAARAVATPAGILLMDVLGRRGCLLAGTLGTSLSMSSAALACALTPLAPAAAKVAAVAGLVSSVTLFELCLSNASFTLASEVFTQQRRQQGVAWSHVCNYAVKAVSMQMFPVALAVGGPLPLWVAFAVMNAAGFVVFFRIVPETAGRSLEDVGEELEAAWRAGEKRAAGAGA